MVDRVERLVIAAEMDARAYVEGVRQKVSADQLLIAGTKAADVAVTEQGTNLNEASGAFRRLLAAQDPVARAQLDLSRNVRIVTRDLELGRISTEDATRALTPYVVALNQARETQQRLGAGGDPLRSLNGSLTGAQGRFRGVGMAAQQAGFQVQDFFVQVASGQSAFVAFAQQGSQLLGILGPAGAIAGAALAIGSVVAQMVLLGEETEKAKKDTLDFGEALRLSKELTGEAATTAKELAEARRQEAIETRKATVETIRKTIADTENAIAAARRAQANAEALNNLGTGIAAGLSGASPFSVAGVAAAGAADDIAELEGRSKDLSLSLKEAEVRLAEATQGVGGFGDEVKETKDKLEDLTKSTAKFLTEADGFSNLLGASASSRMRNSGLPAGSDAEYERWLKAREAAGLYRTEVEKIADTQRESARTLEDLSNVVGTAFEDAVLNGEKLRDVLAGLVQDLGRMAIRQYITAPLQEALFGSFQSASGGNGLSGILKSGFSAAFSYFSGGGSGFGGTGSLGPADGGGKFAMGGVMTPDGPLPLQRYAMGGIASTPQIALFGEGRTPEAYVPLPDGRRIPVAMQGDAGRGVVINAPITIKAVDATGFAATAKQTQRQISRGLAGAARRM